MITEACAVLNPPARSLGPFWSVTEFFVADQRLINILQTQTSTLSPR